MLEIIKKEIAKVYPKRGVYDEYEIACSQEVLDEVHGDFNRLVDLTIIRNGEEPITRFSHFRIPGVGTLIFNPTLEIGYTIKQKQ